MKKIIKTMVSMLAAVMMLLSAASFSVLAETTGEGLIFEMDLSGSTAEKAFVRNAVSGNSTTYGLEQAPATGTVNGQTYLKFRQSTTDTDAGKYVKIVDPTLLDNDNMTFEFWVRPRYLNSTDTQEISYRMAAMAVGGSSDTENRLDIYCNGHNMYYRPGGPDNATNYEMHSKLFNLNVSNSWTHFVFTREWVPSTESDNSLGTWKGAVYVNGTKLEPAATKANNQITKASEKNLFMIIGNHRNLNNAFIGDIAEVKVYNTLLSDDTITTKYTARKSAYDALTVKSVSPSANLSTVGGTIQATFSEAVNARTLSGITLKAADGGATVPVSVSLKNDDVTAVITYGVLTEGASYTLTLPSSVKSWNKSLEEAGYTFTATKKDVIVDTDFSEAQTVPELAGMIYDIPNDDGKTYISIQQTTDGSDRYLAVSGQTNEHGKNFKVKHTLQNQFSNNSVTGDQYVIEMKLRRTLTSKNAGETAQNVAGDVFNVSCDPAAIKLGEISYQNILPYYDWSYTESTWTKSAYHESTLDDNGFATLRLVITADEVDDTKVFGFEQYDDGTYIEGSRIDPNAEGVKAPTQIYNVTLAHIYTQASDNAYAENDFSAFKIYERRQTQILSFGEYDETANTVTMALSNGLQDGEAAKITVRDAQNDETVNVTATAGDNNTVTLAFNEPLSGSYTVSLNEAIDADGILCSSHTADFVAVGSPAVTVSYTDENGNELTTLQEKTTVMATATLSNWTDEENLPVGFLAIYDGGKLVGLKQATVSAEDTTVTFEASVKGLTALSDKANAKFMIVKSLNSLAPVVSADDFQSAKGGSL